MMNRKSSETSNKIRDLYRQKGILNGEALRPEILKSWERSKIYQSGSESFGFFERTVKNTTPINPEIQIFFEDIVGMHPSIRGIYLVYDDGQIQSSHVLDATFLGLESWSERKIGTTSFNLLKEYDDVFVLGQGEHFLPQFDDFATLALPISGENSPGKSLISLVMILANVIEIEKITRYISNESAKLTKLSNLIEADLAVEQIINKPKISKNISEDSEFSNYNPHLIEGISREIVEFRSELKHLNSKHLYLRICAETVNEGISAVSYLIENEKSKNNKNPLIAMVSEEKIHQHIDISPPEKLDFDVLIVVGLHKLTYSQQKQIYRAIQDKREVVSTARGFKKMNHKIYLVDTLKDHTPEKANLVLDGLKILQNSPKIILPPINRRRQDIAMVVKVLEKQLGENDTNGIRSIAHSLARHPEIINWQGSADELSRWVIFNHGQRHQPNIIEGGFIDQIVEVENSEFSLNSGMGQRVDDLRTDEKIHISKALEVYKYNVNKTAKALGIARSTLYRKIENYGLMIERQKKNGL